MKTKFLILIAIVFMGFFCSCNKPEETISKQTLINLIEADQVKEINIENGHDVHIILKKEADRPNGKMQIGSSHAFKNSIEDIAIKHGVAISQTFDYPAGFGIFMPALILFARIFLYFIGGVICLFITMKNEFINSTDKIAWVITIIFAPVIGVLLFIILGRKQIKKNNKKSEADTEVI